MWPFSDSEYSQIISKKRAARSAALLAVAQDVKSAGQSTQILHATATEIVAAIERGTWTARQVVETYIGRAVVAQSQTNCITEVLFEQALAEADALDEEYARTKTLKGPLHGVPMSFKDQFDIEGYDTSIGFTGWANKPAEKDAELVTQIRAAGGIIIAKTNVPQTMLSFECSNPLWGTSSNPWNDKYTPGGSSGGEAALLACDGAALGIGSDVGGSLRIPVGYCGIYSIKPAGCRVSKAGARGPNPGMQALNVVLGPMGRSVDDIKLASQLMFGAGDSNGPRAYPPVPYRQPKLAEKLKFGYYTSDGCCKASPACARAVMETVDALRKQGHECVEFVPPDVVQALEIFVALSAADGYATLLSHLGPDPRESSLFLVTLGPKLPSLVRWLAVQLVRLVKNDPIFERGFSNSRVRSVREYWQAVKQKDDYNIMWYREVWEKHGFDGIIAPVQASPALPHGATKTLSPLAIATFLYNVVDSPIGTIPVTRVDPTKDALTEEWKKGPGHGSVIVEEDLYYRKNAPYNPEAMKGLPVAVQVIGKAWEEEKVIEMMKVVDQALGPRGFGPGSWSPKVESEAANSK